MACADTRMKKEIECPLCMDVFKNPVVAGPCIHSFCFECLQRHIELGGHWRKFPCPLCRKECPLPSDGVKGLTTNFTLANIIEIEQTRSKASSLNKNLGCHVCTEISDVTDIGYCQDCDGAFLCRGCCRSHSLNAMTRDHALFGLCSSHVKPQKDYCRTCHRFLCGVCLASGHGGHDVIRSAAIVTKSRATLFERMSTGSSYMKEVMNNVSEVEKLCAENLEKWQRAEKQVESKHTSAKRHVTDRLQTIEMEMERLSKEKEDLLPMETILDERKASLFESINTECKKSNEVLEDAVRKFKNVRDGLKQTLERADQHVTGCVYSEDVYLETVQTEKDLKEFHTRRNEVSLCGITEDLNKCRIFVPGGEMFDLGCLQWKRLDLQFLADWPHDVIYNVVNVPGKRIVALIHCSTLEGAYGNALLLWDNPHDAPEILTEKIDEATFLTCSGEDLLIFRRKPPYLRVFDHGGDWIKDADVTFGKRRNLKAWSGAVDKKQGFFFVDSTSSPIQLLAYKESSVYKRDFPYNRLTFCEQTETFLACDDRKVTRFKWMGNKMESLRTGTHGIPKFHALDIACDNGLMRLVGVTAGSQIRVYRVEEDGSSGWALERLDLFGDYLHLRSESSHPRISVSGNQLAITHDIGITVFLLNQP